MTVPIATENPLDIYNVESGKQLLREYSGVSDAEFDAHVESIRDMALQVAPYPCLRRFRFLDLVLCTTPAYPSLLSRVRSGAVFLDLACCLGQEIRKLVHDGAPSERTYGADLHDGFFRVGYDLFRDHDRLRTTFLAADLFDDTSVLVAQLAGRVDIVYVGDLFHLFGLAQQEAAAARVVQLLRAAPGSVLVGRHAGARTPGEDQTAARSHFSHDAESWKTLWRRVGERTGTSWTVEAELVPEFKFARAAGAGAAAAYGDAEDEKGASGSDEVERLRGAMGLVYTITRQ
ncbi:hypothetical protein PWT90_08376 [Aphanocladium album]|nr:hypothetical protein PWT90_08376 [Aphanocladium album]